jgi:abortive infection bacteriophage resistance protein
MRYRKPPLSIAEQVNTLKSRGLIISDEKRAKHYLSYISLYRFRAYKFAYQDNSNPKHPFYPESTFEKVLNTYLFDRKLRVLVFDALERIEIAFRAQIIHIYSIKHGANWFENALLFRKQHLFERDTTLIDKELRRSNEVFIKHYKKTYTDPVQPPAWMTLEVTGLGLLSKIFENLKISNEKKTIARNFNLGHPFILENWMHSLTVIRNICAHHGRLWNRESTARMTFPNNTRDVWLSNSDIHKGKMFLVLSSILHLLNTIILGNHFKEKLIALIKEHPDISLRQMGFPNGWENENLWLNK